MNLFYKAKGRFVADVDSIRPQYQLNAPDANALFQSAIVRDTGLSVGATIDQLDTQVTNLYSEYELALPSYSDQVLPFDVTLSGANEYGAMTAAKILGIEILNEGSGISVDDAVSEASATFVAGALKPMQDLGSSSCRTTNASRVTREAG